MAVQTQQLVAAQLPIFFQLLLQRYQDVVNPSKVLVALSHRVFHHLRMEGPPIALLDAENLAAAKADFIKMVEGGGHHPLVQQSFGISSSSG
jgi:hypothetical protein